MEYTISQTSEMTGISADTLRFYEKERIFSPSRHDNGYRYYKDEDIVALKYIAVMKYAQFSLSEIRSMEELLSCDKSTECNELSKRILNNKISQLKQAISNYQNIIELMERLLPMIETPDAYFSNQLKIDEYISKIYDDIKKGQ